MFYIKIYREAWMFNYHYMITMKGILLWCFYAYTIYDWLLYVKNLNYAVNSRLIEAFFPATLHCEQQICVHICEIWRRDS